MIKTIIKGIPLEFETNNNVFSPSAIDKGTLAMLSQIEFNQDNMVLDLGCGYGVVGILASKIIGAENVAMCDISDDAVNISKLNAILNNVSQVKIIKSNGLDDIVENNFTHILSNPPYQADFSVPKNFIEKGFYKLAIGGKIFMVTKRKEWYKNKLKSVFGNVQVEEVDGYFVFTAEKLSLYKPVKLMKEQSLSKKLKRKYKNNKENT
ncbi:MAG: methyltransferase [Clostridiales bacterium GWF2_36_10]|nr:MAG: methyltransferase [Clostridiales bacterium GWF2_36_10]HAN20099.1 methyltransferase [Clostridiales bacterium]